MSVTQKTRSRTSSDTAEQDDELLKPTVRDESIEDPIKEVLSDPVVDGPVTSEDTSVSNSEIESDDSGQVDEVADRLSKALDEKEEKLGRSPG